jgi:uncharacterized protein YijF (DUF1287 family)
MKQLVRITFNPAVMGGKPCIRACHRRNHRRTNGLWTYTRRDLSRLSIPKLLDIYEALTYAAWRVEEIEISLASA